MSLPSETETMASTLPWEEDVIEKSVYLFQKQLRKAFSLEHMSQFVESSDIRRKGQDLRSEIIAEFLTMTDLKEGKRIGHVLNEIATQMEKRVDERIALNDSLQWKLITHIGKRIKCLCDEFKEDCLKKKQEMEMRDLDASLEKFKQEEIPHFERFLRKLIPEKETFQLEQKTKLETQLDLVRNEILARQNSQIVDLTSEDVNGIGEGLLISEGPFVKDEEVELQAEADDEPMSSVNIADCETSGENASDKDPLRCMGNDLVALTSPQPTSSTNNTYHLSNGNNIFQNAMNSTFGLEPTILFPATLQGQSFPFQILALTTAGAATTENKNYSTPVAVAMESSFGDEQLPPSQVENNLNHIAPAASERESHHLDQVDASSTTWESPFQGEVIFKGKVIDHIIEDRQMKNHYYCTIHRNKRPFLRSSVKDHVNCILSDEDKPFSCSTCTKKFGYKRGLNFHQKSCGKKEGVRGRRRKF